MIVRPHFLNALTYGFTRRWHSSRSASGLRTPGDTASAIAITPRVFTFRYRSAQHFIDVFRTWYGPVHKAFAALPEDKAAELERDLLELLNSMNRAGNASLVVPGDYVEVVVTRR